MRPVRLVSLSQLVNPDKLVSLVTGPCETSEPCDSTDIRDRNDDSETFSFVMYKNVKSSCLNKTNIIFWS